MMKNSLRKQQAARVIEEHFAQLRRLKPNEDVLVSAREAGRRLVEVFRLLTDDMPQAVGIDIEFTPDERPALEWASPTERDPNELYAVDVVPGGPDILTPRGDQHGNQESNQENCLKEGAGEGIEGRSKTKALPPKT